MHVSRKCSTKRVRRNLEQEALSSIVKAILQISTTTVQPTVVRESQLLDQTVCNSKMAATKKIIEDRLRKVESAIETIMERLGKIEEKVDRIEPIRQRVDEAADQLAIQEIIADKLAIQEIIVMDKVKEISDETDIKLTSSELRCDDGYREEVKRISGQNCRNRVESRGPKRRLAYSKRNSLKGWSMGKSEEKEHQTGKAN